MANKEHLDILKQGVEVWNKWREKNPEIKPDLSIANPVGRNLNGAYLNSANLYGANLSEANLEGANLFEAHLEKATLNKAELSKANLNGANLERAYLGGANLSRVNLSGSDLDQTDLSEANLSRAILNRAILIETNLTNANLEGCSIYGISAWDLKLEGAKQSNLIITRDDEPVITVDDLEVAQFIYLLLNHKKLRNVINSVTERGVLILGHFSDGGLEVLQSIAAKLREMKYLPIIFDFDRPSDRNYTETVKTLVGLSRFVIVDLSGPSVPHELYATVPHFKIPFVPIMEKGRNSYAMFLDIMEYNWVLKPPVEFANKEQLIELMPSKIVASAEEMHKERQKLLEQLFNR